MLKPNRHRWAVELAVSTRPATVLEIGCGPGEATRLLGETLPGTRVIAIDRSATAIARATARLATLPDGGRVTLRQVAIADLDLPDASIDVVVGVNVNVFWTSRATRELAVLGKVLRPGGALHLVYEPPGPDPWVRDGVERAFREAGWTSSAQMKRRLVAITGTPGSR